MGHLRKIQEKSMFSSSLTLFLNQNIEVSSIMNMLKKDGIWN